MATLDVPEIHLNGDGTVTLRGWNEWLREVRQAGSMLDREMTWRSREIAKMVKARAITQAATKREKKVARSLSLGASTSGATVTLKPSKRLPDAFGREFGAKRDLHRNVRAWWSRRLTAKDTGRTQTLLAVFKKKITEPGMVGWNQFAPWRGNQWENPTPTDMGGPAPGVGYFLWPAIRQSSSDILEMYADAVVFVARQRAFPN